MSSLLVINIFFFFVGILLFCKKRSYTIYYFLTWKIAGAFLCDMFLFPVENNLFETFGKYSNLYIYACLILTFFTDKINTLKKGSIILMSFCIFLIYIIGLALFRETITPFFFNYILQYFTWVALFLLLPSLELKLSQIRNFSYFLLIVELVLFFLQDNGIALTTYSKQVDFFFYAPPGTYYRYNFYASGISCIIIFLMLIELVIRKKVSTLQFIIYIAGSATIYLSGSRTALIAYVLTCCIILLKVFYKRIKYFIIPVLFLIPTLYGILLTNQSNSDFGANVGERQANILAIFSDNGYYLTEESTFGLSVKMFNYLINNLQSLLFGAGRLFTSQLGYNYVKIESSTDATLMVYICETGIIGFIFLIYFLIYTLQVKKEYRFFSYAFLGFFIILTITDIGLFYTHDFAFFLVLMFFLKNSSVSRRDFILKSNRITKS